MIIDNIAIKGIGMIILASLQNKVLNQLHINYMGIRKTRLLACKPIYWVNMTTNIEDMIKSVSHTLIFRQHHLRTKQYLMKYHEDHGNLKELIFFQIITNTILVM